MKFAEMDDIKTRLYGATGGAFMGLFGAGKIWFAQMNNMYWEFPLKLIGTIILTLFGALVGYLVKDLYTYRIKDWWVNFIKKDKNKKQ